MSPLTPQPTSLVLHASDLHIGAHIPEMLIRFGEFVRRRAPRLTILSGDLTDGGRSREYSELAGFLSTLPGDVFVAPGNHDSPVDNLFKRLWSPFAQFNALGAHKNYFHGEGLLVGELRTAEPIQFRLDWSKGVATPDRVKNALDNLLRREPAVMKAVAPPWRILVGHHPLLDAPNVDVPGSVIGGLAAEQRCDAQGVDLILSGHTHESWVARVAGSNVLLATAPTLSSPRTRGELQGFHAYRLSAVACTCEVWRWQGSDFALESSTIHKRRADASLVGTN